MHNTEVRAFAFGYFFAWFGKKVKIMMNGDEDETTFILIEHLNLFQN